MRSHQYAPFWLPVFFWMLLIFLGSAIPNADFSSSLETERLIHLGAHLVEYSVLGALLARAFLNTLSGSRRFYKWWGLASFLVAFLYALTDEYHQTFTVGRLAKVSDVRNDALGALLGIAVWAGAVKVLNKKGKVTSSPQETEFLGSQLAERLRGGEVIALDGELGSGKTTFVRGLFTGLGCQGRVLSPTFVLQRRYQGTTLRLVHVDWYRLNSLEEIGGLGLQEEMEDPESVVVIEWAEKGGQLLPDDVINVNFRYRDANKREVLIGSLPPQFAGRAGWAANLRHRLSSLLGSGIS